jgi:hypothetical protein
MAFVKMPKDLTKIKSKAALNLTIRQLIVFGTAGVIGIPIFFLTRSSLGMQGAGFLTFLIVCPFFLVGLYERNGQPFEKVLRNVLNLFFFRPRRRLYMSKNSYQYLIDQADLEEEIKKIKKENAIPIKTAAKKKKAKKGSNHNGKKKSNQA